MNFNALRDKYHQASVNAGWWDEHHHLIIPTKMMLIISEISEADTSNGQDDKLPHLTGFAVELGDVAIRLFDLLGALGAEADTFLPALPPLTKSDQMMLIVNYVSAAMECDRIGDAGGTASNLRSALGYTFAIADWYDIDLLDILEQKGNYNAQRADHKPENRAKKGGKKY